MSTHKFRVFEVFSGICGELEERGETVFDHLIGLRWFL